LGAYLTTGAKRMRIIGRHIIRLVAMGGALTGMLYAQQAASPITCSNGLSDKAFESGLLEPDASRFSPDPHYGGIEYRFVSSYQNPGANRTPDGLAPGRLWASPFSSFLEGSAKSCGSDVRADRTGDSVASTENAGSLRSPGLAEGNLWAQNQPSPPAPPSTQSFAEQGSPKHIFLLVPAFHVAYVKEFKPLTPHEKFHEWLQNAYDPRGIGMYAFEAGTLEHSTRDGFCGYGKHWGDYGKCFGSMELDSNISSFLGDFLFPVILHQDARYFRRGEGHVGGRMLYAVSRVFLTHADSGGTVFFSAALAGSAIAAAASNLYLPAQDRGFGPSLNRMGLDLANTAVYNVAAEFWPDIQDRLGRRFRRSPPAAKAAFPARILPLSDEQGHASFNR